MVIFINEETGRVFKKHFKPELLPKKDREKGYEVDESMIPEVPDRKLGKRSVLYYDKDLEEFYYLEEDRELTQEEQIKLLTQRVLELEDKIKEA